MFRIMFSNPSLKASHLVLLFMLFRHGFCDSNAILGDAKIDVDESVVLSSEDEILVDNALTTTSVKFFLRLPDNQTVAINSTDLLNSSQPIKLLIHGESEDQYSEWVDQLVSIYHMKGGYNVVTVDWSKASTQDNFYYAAAVNETGDVIAEFIMEVTEDRVEALEDVHLIGNGLGAHVGGAAGKKVKNKKHNKIGRITGLDPEKSQAAPSLNPDDAEFVDVIHTASISGEESCGTVDFYVLTNDTSTPICINDTCIVATEAHDYFSLSLLDAARYEAISCENATAFLGNLCSDANTTVLGEYVSRNATGNYYIQPNSALSLYKSNQFLAVVLALIVYYFMNN